MVGWALVAEAQPWSPLAPDQAFDLSVCEGAQKQ